MTPTPNHHENIERLIRETLRDLPNRTAPRSLEERVFAEIQRRAALPWWRKSFMHWPIAARAAFIVLSAGLVKLAFLFGMWVTAGVDPNGYKQTFAQQFTWVDSAFAVAHAITGSIEIILRNIPSLWLYGSLAFFAAMYFTLFGLGAAAYKALHIRR
jgi:hypothetical protein